LPERRGLITTIYLIRHGETDWNRNRRIQGWADIPLNARGQGQAQAVARRLAALPLDRIFTSDLARASETAERIAGRQAREVPIVRTPALRESDYGLWEGMIQEEVPGRFPEAWKEWVQGGGLGPVPGGEDFIAVTRRVTAVYDAAIREAGTVAICSHHSPIQAILCHALGIGAAFRSRFLILNCSLNALEIPQEGPTRLILLNGASHLDGLG
jgi:probable phosphoglycerate mutase